MVGVVEVSALRAYLRVTLVSASILSGLAIKTLRDGKGLPEVLYLVASSLGHLHNQYSKFCGTSLQREHGGSAEESRRLAQAFSRAV